MKIAMLSMEKYENRRPEAVGSSRIRCRWVMKYDKRLVPFKNGVKYDAVIYQKAYWKEHMKRFPGIKIFDLCDPDWMEGKPITEVAEMVDGFTVPTQALADFIGQLTEKPIMVIPDRIDPEEHTPVKSEHIGKARSVVWFGYSSNQEVLDQTVVFLKSKMLQLVVVSDRNYHDADINVPYDYRTIHEELIRHDFVLMPDYKKNLRHSFKSPNKTLTSWALGLPVAIGPEDIERFMSAEEREKESKMRRAEVLEKHHSRLSGPEYVNFINDIMKRKGVDDYGKK